MIKKILLTLLLLALFAVGGFAGFAWWSLQPKENPQALPDGLIAISDPDGEALLQDADAKADYLLLSENYESQELRSYCGVASSVAVLNALGHSVDQDSFFDVDADNTKSEFDVMFGGMTLEELGALLAAHDVQVEVIHGDLISVDEFRAIVYDNLQAPDDYLLINYQREVLGQRRVGHISPVSAYDIDTDHVLIMDTASYNYPPTWVPLEELHAAMLAVDSPSGKSRGLVQVSANP